MDIAEFVEDYLRLEGARERLRKKDKTLKTAIAQAIVEHEEWDNGEMTDEQAEARVKELEPQLDYYIPELA